MTGLKGEEDKGDVLENKPVNFSFRILLEFLENNCAEKRISLFLATMSGRKLLPKLKL